MLPSAPPLRIMALTISISSSVLTNSLSKTFTYQKVNLSLSLLLFSSYPIPNNSHQIKSDFLIRVFFDAIGNDGLHFEEPIIFCART